MKTPPDNPEFARFTEAMRAIMGVSKAELIERLKDEEASNGKKGKRPISSASPSAVSSSTPVD